ncbi:DUF4136 domain-containing protein, partial [Pseudomonas sp. NPDC089554]
MGSADPADPACREEHMPYRLLCLALLPFALAACQGTNPYVAS